MRTPMMAGNWKMNTTIHEGVELVIRLRELIRGVDEVEVVLAPPYPSLYHIGHVIAGSPIRLAAQNVFWEKKGAYTGEVSPAMLKAVGCHYAIVGHSERRQHFGETDEIVNRKVIALIREGLKPIVCVGETLEEREGGKTLQSVSAQVRGALASLPVGAVRELTLAYEPVWAIGTGKNAAPEDAEEVHHALRDLLIEMFEAEPLKELRIIYGGSVKPENIDDFMAQPNIDGALVGGASLNPEDFARIVKFRSR